MKTEIIIWQGAAKVVLYPENEFEKELIEKIKDSKKGYQTETNVLTDYTYQMHSKHRIEISLNENIT
jgi:predicted HTH domain antitoxin